MHSTTSTFFTLLLSTLSLAAPSRHTDSQRHFSVGQESKSQTNNLNANAANPPFNYGTDKVRGVNLGGWLVAEPWITPSLFDE